MEVEWSHLSELLGTKAARWSVEGACLRRCGLPSATVLGVVLLFY